MTGLPWVFNDGGRSDAGFRGDTGDCVTRAISIATGISYQRVYHDLFGIARATTVGRDRRRLRDPSPRTGVLKKVWLPYLEGLGAVWTPTMQIGSGCQVHVRRGEVPDQGRYILRLSRHLSALVDGVVYDTYDPGRDGTRCVYGWFEIP